MLILNNNSIARRRKQKEQIVMLRKVQAFDPDKYAIPGECSKHWEHEGRGSVVLSLTSRLRVGCGA